MAFQKTPLRRLGKDGTLVPALGLGLMGMSFLYGTAPSDEDRFAVLDRAVELGATNWDTAEDSEEMLGKWFKRSGKRDQIFLASKFGFIKNSVNWTTLDTSAAYCKKACEESLRILGIDYIDLYYMHRVSSKTPIEETMRAMAELKAREGKIKHIGLSEISSATLRRAYKIAPVDAVQIEYSAFALDIENEAGTDLLATCRELGVTVFAYSPLGRGLLTGTLSQATLTTEGDLRTILPRFQDENFTANLKLVEQFKKLASKKGCSPAQLALAWLLKQGDDIIPIPGTKKIKYLEENWSSLQVTLTDEEEEELRQFVASAGVAGGRSGEGDTLFGDTVEE